MRLVFLNTWEGTVTSPFEEFIKKESPQTDIFCFQEADQKVRSLMEGILTDFQMVNDYKYLNDNEIFNQVTYIKNNLFINSQNTLFQGETDTGLCLYSQIKSQDRILNLSNVHGISRPGDKLDTPGRLRQSQTIVDFFKDFENSKIVGGDFNLDYDVQSVKTFEENGYRNLIKDYKIPTTRNNLAWNMYPDCKQLYADFLFVSPDIKVIDFTVPNIDISDHLPLILEIDNF